MFQRSVDVWRGKEVAKNPTGTLVGLKLSGLLKSTFKKQPKFKTKHEFCNGIHVTEKKNIVLHAGNHVIFSKSATFSRQNVSTEQRRSQTQTHQADME